MAGTHNFRANQGETFSKVLTWKDSAGTPITLTGYTAKMQVRLIPGTTVIIELSTVNGRIVLGGIAGTITLTIAATDSAALPPGEYRYDLEMTTGGGVVTRLLEGQFTVKAEITT